VTAFERAGRGAWDVASGATPAHREAVGRMRAVHGSSPCGRSLPAGVGPTVPYGRDGYLLDLPTVDWYGEL